MTRSLADIEHDLAHGYEHQGETEAQYYSERSMFGDAGPGQWLDVCEGRVAMRELEAEWRLAGGDVVESPEWAVWIEDEPADPLGLGQPGDDIPF